jgi:hypothetical protein
LNINLPRIDKGYNNGLDCKEVAPVFEKGLDLFLSDKYVQKTCQYKEFNLILFRRSGYISHIGVCLNSKYFIHADLGSLSCIEKIRHTYWKNRTEGIYEYTSTS